MAKQILNEEIVDDPYHVISTVNELTQYTHVVVPLELYVEEKSEFDHYNGEIGLRIGTDVELTALIPYLHLISLIDIHYTSFTDGRGHSLARLLREAHHFNGILRASGDVFKDTVFYLKRCGFNSFLVKENETLEHALQGFKVFSESYQAAFKETPLFRRRFQLA